MGGNAEWKVGSDTGEDDGARCQAGVFMIFEVSPSFEDEMLGSRAGK